MRTREAEPMHPSDSTPQRIRILLIEDSPTEIYLLRKLFQHAPDLEIAGVAQNGREALDMLPGLQPDIICTDYHMPVMGGLEFILRATKLSTCPIMVLSVAVQGHQKDNIFKLLSAGAVAVVAKPTGTIAGITPDEGRELFDMIREIARSHSNKTTRSTDAPVPVSQVSDSADGLRTVTPDPHGVALVVIGASTGGPQILSRLFAKLPATYPVPIVCVQHISNGFLGGLVSWLQHECKLAVKIAEPGDAARPGHVYFAPDGMDLKISGRGIFMLEPGGAPNRHCPSIDSLFFSVAREFGPKALGILLTGMGRDGAAGLKAMIDAGAATIAQNEETSVIFGMPGAAIALGAARFVLSTDDISRTLARLKVRG